MIIKVKPEVSIIIPAYNSQDTIMKTVNSILKTDNRNLELIVINDGSTDDTFEVISKLNDVGHIRIINQSNKGVAAARNRGIRLATGKYCMFVDSDDLIGKNTIKEVIRFADRNKLNLVCFNHFEVNSTQLKKGQNNNKCFIACNPSDIAKHYDDFYVQSSCGKLIRTEFLTKNNIQFNENMVLGEDLDFSLRLFSKIERVGYVGSSFYEVQNTNPSSLSKKYVPYLYRDIDKQYSSWLTLIRKNIYIKKVYNEHHICFELYLMGVLFSNMFSFDCPLSENKKINLIKKLLLRYDNWLDKGKRAFGTPQNSYEKLLVRIILSRNVLLIYCFFFTKEKVRRLKFYSGRRKQQL